MTVLLDFPQLTTRHLIPLSAEEAEVHSTFHGQFPKYSLLRDGKEYIVKPRPPGYPDLPVIEFVCNVLARELGLAVPSFGLVSVQGEPAFVSEQFIAPLVALHGAANLNHLVKYIGETDLDGWSCERIIGLLRQEASEPEGAVRRFAEVCLFDALVGNADRHQRNLALIEHRAGIELSPFYDNTSYLAMVPEEDALKLDRVYGCIRCAGVASPGIKEYAGELSRLGLGETVRSFVSRVNVERLLRVIDESPLPGARKQAFGRFISLRAKELCL